MPAVFIEDEYFLPSRELKLIYGYQLKSGGERRPYLLTEIKKMIEDGDTVPIVTRPKKEKEILPPIMPDYIELQLKPAHLYTTLQGLQRMIADIRSLQAVLTEYNVVVSWGDEKKQVAVVPKRRRTKSKKG